MGESKQEVKRVQVPVTHATRNVRLDLPVMVTVQLKVNADSTPAQAREQALRTVNAAIRRAEEDGSIKFIRQPDEKFYDPRAKGGNRD